MVDGRPSDLVAVGVGVQSEKVLGDGAIACLPSVRTAANGGEQFVNGGAQPLRHLIEEIVGEKDVGVAERDFFEGGDAEGVLCADPDTGGTKTSSGPGGRLRSRCGCAARPAWCC